MMHMKHELIAMPLEHVLKLFRRSNFPSRSLQPAQSQRLPKGLGNRLVIILALMGASSGVEAAAPPAGSRQVQIVAEDMCCKGCFQKVARQLYAARGVTNVAVNLENKTVVVTVSKKKGATLEQLWQAVDAGKGGPAKLTTAEATFSMTHPKALASKSLPSQGTTHVVIDNLHCKGCAKKIAAQLYTIRGVSKVDADMQQNTMIVTNNGKSLSPWALVGAVTNAKERPLKILGASGRMDIVWSAPKTGNAHQARQSNNNPSNHRGVQR